MLVNFPTGLFYRGNRQMLWYLYVNLSMEEGRRERVLQK
jgi:hypothetical protein